MRWQALDECGVSKEEGSVVQSGVVDAELTEAGSRVWHCDFEHHKLGNNPNRGRANESLEKKERREDKRKRKKVRWEDN